MGSRLGRSVGQRKVPLTPDVKDVPLTVGLDDVEVAKEDFVGYSRALSESGFRFASGSETEIG
jgi:hypothetical protein